MQAQSNFLNYPLKLVTLSVPQRWQVFAAAIFLVSVPVFIQAPLVRLLPALSLVCTALLMAGAWHLLRRPATQLWGDMLLGFAWTWLAGSIYWGWLRWEPLIHLPIEAIGLPAVVFLLWRNTAKVGSWFYLGSLFGTVITDVYFYLTDLIPYWRELMQVDSTTARAVLHQALLHISTPSASAWAIVLVSVLFLVGYLPLRSQRLQYWAFSGAVLSTILVDGLFWLVAIAA